MAQRARSGGLSRIPRPDVGTGADGQRSRARAWGSAFPRIRSRVAPSSSFRSPSRLPSHSYGQSPGPDPTDHGGFKSGLDARKDLIAAFHGILVASCRENSK